MLDVLNANDSPAQISGLIAIDNPRVIETAAQALYREHRRRNGGTYWSKLPHSVRETFRSDAEVMLVAALGRLIAITAPVN